MDSAMIDAAIAQYANFAHTSAQAEPEEVVAEEVAVENDANLAEETIKEEVAPIEETEVEQATGEIEAEAVSTPADALDQAAVKGEPELVHIDADMGELEVPADAETEAITEEPVVDSGEPEAAIPESNPVEADPVEADPVEADPSEVADTPITGDAEVTEQVTTVDGDVVEEIEAPVEAEGQLFEDATLEEEVPAPDESIPEETLQADPEAQVGEATEGIEATPVETIDEPVAVDGGEIETTPNAEEVAEVAEVEGQEVISDNAIDATEEVPAEDVPAEVVAVDPVEGDAAPVSDEVVPTDEVATGEEGEQVAATTEEIQATEEIGTAEVIDGDAAIQDLNEEADSLLVPDEDTLLSPALTQEQLDELGILAGLTDEQLGAFMQEGWYSLAQLTQARDYWNNGGVIAEDPSAKELNINGEEEIKVDPDQQQAVIDDKFLGDADTVIPPLPTDALNNVDSLPSLDAQTEQSLSQKDGGLGVGALICIMIFISIIIYIIRKCREMSSQANNYNKPKMSDHLSSLL